MKPSVARTSPDDGPEEARWRRSFPSVKTHDEKPTPSGDGRVTPVPARDGTGWIWFVAAVAVLLGVNWILSPKDPGWLGINPSPWLLVPVWLGFRHGYGSGALSGLFVSALVLGGQHWLGDGKLLALLGEGMAYSLWCFPLVGVLGAFVKGRHDRRVARLEREAGRIGEALARRGEDLAILQQNETLLKRAMVSRGMETAGVADGFRHLFAATVPERLDEKFLALLDLHCGVLASVVYDRGKEGRYRKAVAHRDSPSLPDSIELGRFPMCRAAVRSGKLATQSRLWGGGGQPGEIEENFLAAIPFVKPGGEVARLLVIHRMRFEEISWEGFWRVETAFSWYENRCRDLPGSVEAHFDSSQALARPAFEQYLAQAVRVERWLGMSSRAILFSPEAGAPWEELREFTEALLGVKGRYEVLGVVPQGDHYLFCLVVPMGSERAAEERADVLLGRLPGLEMEYGAVPLDEKLFETLGMDWPVADGGAGMMGDAGERDLPEAGEREKDNEKAPESHASHSSRKSHESSGEDSGEQDQEQEEQER